VAIAAPAEAQQVRIRGKIEAVDLPVISVRTTQLILTYPGGQKTVILPPGVPIVRNVPGAASDVKPGVGIIVFAAEPQSDGTVKAARITVGKDGVDPPM
jgi:hypothetical protein